MRRSQKSARTLFHFAHLVKPAILICMVLAAGMTAFAEEAAVASKGTKVSIAGDAFELTAPSVWKAKQPRSRIIAHEFSIPAAEGEQPGRLTIMGAGGSIEANINRWKGQFKQSSKSKVSEKEIAGQKVSLVDISGTFNESIGPPIARKTVERPGYRMLAAIVQTKGKGNYFVKLYGPAKTIAAAEKPFHGFVESLQAAK